MAPSVLQNEDLMEQLLIPKERARLLSKEIRDISKRLECKLRISQGNTVVIDGEPYAEYNAKNVIQAFGRGFDMRTSYKLLQEAYFFKYIDMKDMLRKSDQIRRIKARIIGEDGKTKKYIESVSNVSMSIYGNTIGLIGTIEDIGIATSAIGVLLGGGTHKKAYRLMELARRRAEEEAFAPKR